MIKSIVGLNAFLVIAFVYISWWQSFGFDLIFLGVSTILILFWFGSLKSFSVFFFPILWFVFYYNIPEIDPEFNIMQHPEARWSLSMVVMVPTIFLAILLSWAGVNEDLDKVNYRREQSKPWLYSRDRRRR